MSLEVVPYQSEWPRRFEEVATRLRRSLLWSALAIDHIGSTAVVGLAAKPIIDVQVTVRNLADINVSAVEAEGFAYVPEITSDVPPPWEDVDASEWNKRYFRLSERGVRMAHVHVREQGRRNQRFALLFRDYLQQSCRHKEAYGNFKMRLAEVVGRLSEPGGAGPYLDLKDPIVHIIADSAEQWADETGWTP